MSNFNNLWNNWYSQKVLTEMKANTANKVVAVSQRIKEKAGLEGLNDSYTRMAAFPEIFGDKLRIVVQAQEDELLVMSKYYAQLKELADASLKDKIAKGFVKDEGLSYNASFLYDQVEAKETKRRLQEDGGGIYEVDVIYYQPTLTIEYINMQDQKKKEIFSILKAFNKFKMKEAADYWAKIQSRYTKDREFIQKLTFNWLQTFKKNQAEKVATGDKAKAIVYSRAPIDVLRMSDHPMISSCHSQGNSFFKCAVQEAVRGGAIAYSVNQEDIQRIIDEDKLQDIEIFEDFERGIEGIVPDGRVRIRRMFDTDSKQEYALPEIRTFGALPPAFVTNVLKWAAENQKSKFTNLETGEFQLPTIKKAIKVGGSYNDNYSSDLYERLAKQVANSFNIKDITIDNFEIEDVYIDEGLDLMTDCQRNSTTILNKIGFSGVSELVQILDYRVICKNNEKVGIASSRFNSFSGDTGGNPEFDDQYVAVEVDYKYEINEYKIKGKFKKDPDSDTIKKIIEKTEELAPGGSLYMLYKLLNLENVNFERSKDFGMYSYRLTAKQTMRFETVEEIDNLKYQIPQDALAYEKYKLDFALAMEYAGVQLGLMEPAPFRTSYAKSLIRDINNSDYMSYYEVPSYGNIITFYLPKTAAQSIYTHGTTGNLKQPTMFGIANNKFLESLTDYFYVYTIPREALRAVLKIPTMDTHPDLTARRNMLSKSGQTITNITKAIQRTCKLLLLNIKSKINPDDNILDYIRFNSNVSSPVIKLDGQTLDSDIQIAFSLKIDLADTLSSAQQQTLLEITEYLYKNFYKFTDNLEKQLIQNLTQDEDELVKNLMSDAYIKGIKGEEPLAEPAPNIKKEDLPNILKQLEEPTKQKASELWEKVNGRLSFSKLPFSAALIDEETIRLYYSTTFEYKKVSPLEGNLFYLDYKLEYYSSPYRSYIIVKCPLVDTGAVGNTEFQTLTMKEVIEELVEVIVDNTWYTKEAIRTTYEKEKQYLSSIEVEEKQIQNAKNRAASDETSNPPPRVIKQTTGASGETPSQEDEKQMKMFERKINKKLIKERLIKWYKRNSQ